MLIRPFEQADAALCAALFYRAVHEGAAPKYSVEQRQAWAPEIPSTEAFEHKLSAQHCYVADASGAVVGFMSLMEDGYLDMAYVAPEERGQRTAKLLCAAIEDKATGLGLRRLSTHASRMAQPFFQRLGWQIESSEEIERDGVLIPRCLMVKRLSD